MRLRLTLAQLVYRITRLFGCRGRFGRIDSQFANGEWLGLPGPAGQDSRETRPGWAMPALPPPMERDSREVRMRAQSTYEFWQSYAWANRAGPI